MDSIIGSQTEKNALFTFAGESMACVRYELYGERAKEEGYLRIADFFMEAARQERQHARRMYRILIGGAVAVRWELRQPEFAETVSNITQSIENEQTEWQTTYPRFADTAEQEGFPQLAVIWRAIAIAEKYHEKRFRAFLQNVRTGAELEAFYHTLIDSARKNAAVRCGSCGYVCEDGIIPAFCPVCGMPPEYFKILS